MARICAKIFLLFIFSLGLTIPRALAGGTNAPTPSKRYLTAYETMATADWLLKRQLNEDASLLYGEALKMFQQLSADYPAWQTNLVGFRISYCREELDKVQNPKQADPYQPSRVSKPAALPAPVPPAKTVVSASEQERAAKNSKALELEKSGDYQNALELYKAVLAANNQEAGALGGAGRCLLKLGQADEARDLLLQWSLIPSPDNNVNLLLALIFCREQQFAKAIQMAEIVLNESSANASAHVIMGVALAGAGQTDAALAEMQKALALDPRLPEAHYNLACLVLKKEPQRKATAFAYYQNALKFGAVPDPALEKRLQK